MLGNMPDRGIRIPRVIESAIQYARWPGRITTSYWLKDSVLGARRWFVTGRKYMVLGE